MIALFSGITQYSHFSWMQRIFPKETRSITQSSRNDSIQLQSVENVREYVMNQSISDQLPSCTLKNATITSQHGKLCFSFSPKDTREEIYTFFDEQTMNQWIAEKAIVDIWEIKDLREKLPTTFYKLQKWDEYGYDEIKTKDKLFDCLTEDYGALWKLEMDAKTIYMHAKRGWIHSRCHEEIDFNNLVHIANNMQRAGFGGQAPKAQCTKNRNNPSLSKCIKATLLSGLAAWAGIKCHNSIDVSPKMTGLLSDSAINAALAYGLMIQSGNQNALTSGALIGAFTSIIPGSFAQNLPPTIENPMGDIMVSTGTPIDIAINPDQIFSDPDGDTLDISFLGVPSFLNSTISPLTLTALINGTGGINNVHVSGNTAYVTRGTIQIWDISDLSNPIRISDFDGGVSNYYELGVRGSYLYACAGTGGFHVIDVVTNPFFPSLVSSFGRIAGSIRRMYCGDDNIIYLGDGGILRAVDLSDPSSPVFLGTIMPRDMREALDVFVDGNFAYIPTGYQGGIDVINITDPNNLVSIGFTATPHRAVGVFVREGLLYLADSGRGLRIYNVADPRNPTLISALNDGATDAEEVMVNGHYAFVSHGTSAGDFEIVDITNSSNPQIYAAYSTGGTPQTALVQGNRIYLPDSDIGLFVFDVNLGRITGTPEPQHRGVHSITITANDGRSESISHAFNVVVSNNPPTVVNPISSQNTRAGEPFELDFNIDDFADLEGDPLTLSVPQLPDWLTFEAATLTLSGVPSSSDVGVTTIGVLATDSFGGNIINTFDLNVINGSSSNDTTTIIAAVVASAGALCLAGMGLTALIVRSKSRKSEDKSPFELKDIKLTGYTVGKEYTVLTEIDEELAEAVFKQTGYRIKVDRRGELTPNIASGNFGTISIAYHRNYGFVAVKIVKGKSAVEASQKEADLQRESEGEHVLSIYNTVIGKDGDELHHFMPLAICNGREVIEFLEQSDDHDAKNAFHVEIARGLFKAIRSIRYNGNSAHLDLKPENIVFLNDGNAYITDFGCAQKIDIDDAAISKAALGDCRYCSPERQEARRSESHEASFDGDAEDLWAIGLILAEFVTEKNAQSFFTGLDLSNPNRSLHYSKKDFEEAINKIDKLQSPPKGSLAEVTKDLLNTDSTDRLTAGQGLKKDCFRKKVTDEDKKELFNALVTSIQNNPTENLSASMRKMSVFESGEQVNLDLRVVVEEEEKNTQDVYYYLHTDQRLYYG